MKKKMYFNKLYLQQPSIFVLRNTCIIAFLLANKIILLQVVFLQNVSNCMHILFAWKTTLHYTVSYCVMILSLSVTACHLKADDHTSFKSTFKLFKPNIVYCAFKQMFYIKE